MMDLRQRLTTQVVHGLERGMPVLVVGGPKMGKTYLATLVVQRAPAVSVVDDSQVSVVQAAVAKGEPVLACAGVEHYEKLIALRANMLWVPLTNLPPKAFREVFGDDKALWARAAGHPHMGAAYHAVGWNADFGALRSRCRELLNLCPQHAPILDDLRKMNGDLRPGARYELLRSRGYANLKAGLDWLVCAGLVTRMIDGDRAGVLPVPMWEAGA